MLSSTKVPSSSFSAQADKDFTLRELKKIVLVPNGDQEKAFDTAA